MMPEMSGSYAPGLNNFPTTGQMETAAMGRQQALRSKRRTRPAQPTRGRPHVSAFLVLPAEIRLVIYKLVVPYKYRIIPRDEIQRLIKAKSRLAKLQSMIPFKKLQDGQVLLRVHSLCRTEVAPLLYGSNQFYFRDLQGSFDWLSQIGPRNASMIRDLNLCTKVDHQYSDSCNERAMKNRFHRALQPMTGLHSLTIWHARVICVNGVFTPRIASLRRARYLATQVPSLTRTYCHGTLLRFTRGGPDKNEIEVDLEAEWEKYWAEKKKKTVRGTKRSAKRGLVW